MNEVLSTPFFFDKCCLSSASYLANRSASTLLVSNGAVLDLYPGKSNNMPMSHRACLPSVYEITDVFLVALFHT